MKVFGFALLLFLPVLAVGCGGEATGDVSGTITYDGQPVDQGTIIFTPVGGKGPTGGGSISGGKYIATKVPVGKAKVTIQGVKVTGKKKMYDDPKADWVTTSENYLPPKYSDGKATHLEYDVVKGEQTKDFQLEK